MIYRKSQTSIEFLILLIFVMFFFVMFLLSIEQNISGKIREERDILVKETALAVQDEINLALKSENGYNREFIIADRIGNQDYKISILENMVYVRTLDGKNAIALPIALVEGNISKGLNKIKKQDGKVYLNL